MNTNNFRPVYMCLLCGKKYSIGTVADLDTSDLAGKHEVHRCEDGGIGLAEFVGFKKGGHNGQLD